jgi:tetratricopeptide (TPR) repeat protein
LGEYNAALGYYERSLRFAERVGNDERIANALNNIGLIHHMWGEYDQTLGYYSRALEYQNEALETGDESRHRAPGGQPPGVSCFQGPEPCHHEPCGPTHRLVWSLRCATK